MKIDELTKLVYNIINNNFEKLNDNNIFKKILEEYEKNKYNNELLLKENNKLIEENKLISEELEELKLYTETLKESIIPADQAIHHLNLKNENYRYKIEELKKHSKKIIKINEKMSEDNKKIKEENEKLIIKIKEKFINERKQQCELIKELKIIIDEMTYQYNNKNDEIDELKNKLEELKNKYENELNFLIMSSQEQKNIIMNIEDKNAILNKTIDDKNNTITETNKQIEELKQKLSNSENEILSLKIFSDTKENKINILEAEKQILKNELETLKSITETKINILETNNKELNNELSTLKSITDNKLSTLESIKQDTNLSTLESINNNILEGGNNIFIPLINTRENNNNEIILNTENIGNWERKTTNKRTQLKNKMFFENELKQQKIKEENESKISNETNKTNKTNNTNNTHISFSTDYLVSYLYDENKLKPKTERTKFNNKNLNSNSTKINSNNIPVIIEKIEENNINNDINSSENTQDNYINLSNLIINSEEIQKPQEIKKSVISEEIQKPQEIKKLVKPIKLPDNYKVNVGAPENNNNYFLGRPIEIKPEITINNKFGGNNNIKKMSVHLVDGIKKMVIGEELTTLTEQEFNIEDKKKVGQIYSKKYRRYKREQDKQNKLIEEFK